MAGPYGNARLAVAFMLWALPLLLALAWLTPPWQNPDEPLHFARAVHVAHGGFVGYRAWTTSGGESDRSVYTAYAAVQHAAMRPDQRLSLEDLAESGSIGWSAETKYTSFPNTAQYPPFFYLPDAACYWVGRALHFSINHTLLMARLLNAGLFTALAGAALAIARRTRLLLLAILILPTTLSLACSASQDSLMQGCAVLAVAIIDRVVAEQREASRREALIATILLTLVAMARPPYVFFLLALGLLQTRPWAPLMRYVTPGAAIVLAWCLLVALHTSVPLHGADMSRQLSFVRAHPETIRPTIIDTLRLFPLGWWKELIGVLGWTDTPLPSTYILFGSAVLVLAALSMPSRAMASGVRRSPWLPALGLALCFLAILVLQFFTWAWPGQRLITGILGRYFTVPAMVASLCLPSLGNRLKPAALAAILGLAVITPAVTFHTLVVRYYLH